MGIDGGGAAQPPDQIFQIGQTQSAEADPQHQRGENGAGGVPPRLLPAVLPQQPGGDGSGAHSHHKADSLDDPHDGVHDAHGAGGAGADLGNKIGVRHVVDRGDEHTDGGGDGKADDRAALRGTPACGPAGRRGSHGGGTGARERTPFKQKPLTGLLDTPAGGKAGVKPPRAFTGPRAAAGQFAQALTYASNSFSVFSTPFLWLRSYPWEAYTPGPISPWRRSWPAERVASTSEP